VLKKQAAKKTPDQEKPARKTGATKVTLKNNGDLTGEIQRRAYELYLERGYQHGDDQADWFRAEAEIKKQYSIARR
jgi:DNA relaxase NicK